MVSIIKCVFAFISAIITSLIFKGLGYTEPTYTEGLVTMFVVVIVFDCFNFYLEEVYDEVQ